MKNRFNGFLFLLFLCFLFCAGIQHLIYQLAEADLQMKTGYLLGIIMGAFVLGSHLFLVSGSDQRPSGFIRKFMLVTTLKFFVYVLLVVIFFFLIKENPRALILHFLLYYIMYTTLEVTLLYKEIRSSP